MLRYALLPIALIQIAMPGLPFVLDWAVSVGSDGPQGAMREPESPPGAFFGIWGVIFLAYLVFGLIALVRDSEVVRRMAAPLVLVALAGSAWMLVEQTWPETWLSYPILLVMLAASFWAARRFDEMRGLGGSPTKFVADLTSGLYAGWLTVAAAISTTDQVRGALGLGPTDVPWAMLALALAIAGGLAVIAFRFVTRSLWYVVALGWGLLGIAVNTWSLTGQHVLALATLAFGAGLVFWRFRLETNSVKLAE